jgi:large subunit ribosomal protein L35
MPKMKTHSGAKKRFKVTAKGHLKHKPAHKSHLLSHEATKRKRRLRGSRVVNKAQEKQVKVLLPYKQ